MRKLILLIIVLLTYPIKGISQDSNLNFFDLSQNSNLDNIIEQLKKDGFEKRYEKNDSDIPSIEYTKSGDGMYAVFHCIYTPKTRQVASYWYEISGGDSYQIAEKLKLLFEKPNMYHEYNAPYNYEWNNETTHIQLHDNYSGWTEFSYEDKSINEQLTKETKPFIDFKDLMEIIAVICLLILMFIYVYFINKREKKKREKEKILEIERKEKQAEIDASYELFANNLNSIYGTPTRVIKIGNKNSKGIIQHNDILVYQQNKKLIVGEKEYDFDDILTCFLNDENKKGSTIIKTSRTKTGSMLGRAAVGALTFGVAGAVVGAVTAKKESTSKVDSNYKGSYTVKIGVKSIEEPTIILRFGNNKSKAEDVYSLIEAIIAMKESPVCK